MVLSLETGGIAFAAKHGHKSSKHGTAGHGSLSITHVSWGTANGRPVDLCTLRNGHGMIVKITNYGGVIQSIWVPARTGALKDVPLGLPRLSDYVNDFQNQPKPAAGGSGDTYLGAIIGRYANRIANHSFTLDGTFNNLPGNNGPNNIDTLHGGADACDTQVWAATPETLAGAVALKLTDTDPNGKNGFPGAVTTVVTYTLTQANALEIAYRATTTAPTVINYTNHTYFNLAGEGSATSTPRSWPSTRTRSSRPAACRSGPASHRSYRQGDAFTLETQHSPDTPHHIGQPGWPSVAPNPGQVFNSKTTYKFTTAGPSSAQLLRNP